MKIKDRNLYYVGGVVRDEMLGVTSIDTDYCYEGDAIEFSKKFNVMKTNPDFGTVRVQNNGEEIDIASTRTETYPKKGHLPVLDKIGCVIVDDLKRRDFTINAMAKNTLTGEVLDYFGGRDDLNNKKIRVLHKESFIDDPTRIVRGLKFAVRFGFELESQTKTLQDDYLKNINYDMSYHRLKKELIETFNLNKNIALEKFIEQGIFKLLGVNQKNPTIIANIESLIDKYLPKNIWLVYLGMFDLSNFELNCEEQEIIDSYNKIKTQNPTDDYGIYKMFKGIPLESVLLYAITINLDVAINYLDNLSKIKIELDGNDLKGLGVKQGKVYSEIFEYLMKEKIKNPNLSKTQEIELVKSFL